MCANNESETLSATAYDILQDIIMLIIERSWYTIGPEDGPCLLYNVVSSDVSLDTRWQKSSYSTDALLKVSRIINEALCYVCPAQPVSQETIQALRCLQTRLISVPASTTQKSLTPAECCASKDDAFSKFFLLSKNSYTTWFTQSDSDIYNKESFFFKEISELTGKEYDNLVYYRKHWEQAWELVSRVINTVRELCNGSLKKLPDYDNHPIGTINTIDTIEKKCAEIYPTFFLHNLERYLESLESKNLWFLQDKLFSYFESIPAESFTSFCQANSSMLPALMAEFNTNELFFNSISEWYHDLSRFSLRRCIMLCTIFIEDASMQDALSGEQSNKFEEYCPKYFINEWENNHSNCTVRSMCESLSRILKKYSA